ncbi:SRPBCC family protein [Pseudofrancisella aestuarii]|uniref:SRPBCC family protein n=1 Tax=Pseudofrancisella aestuarii TaxID=2670347 RepID=A0ABV9TAT6_9GAMM|nr:SRPBCC family protein [Pseudofrancisella aestuarii]
MNFLKFTVNVNTSIDINAELEDVRKIIGDFNKWKEFSPWKILDENTENHISKDGKEIGSIMSWSSKYTGEGEIELTKKVDHGFFYELRFFKPFKSKAKSLITFHSEPNATRVFWHMKTKLPIFLIFFKKIFINMIISDLDRGLKMLKALIEVGKVNSKIENSGTAEFGGQSFIGIKTENCLLKYLPGEMTRNFEKLKEFVGEKNLESAKFFSIYHSTNMKTMEFNFTTAVSFNGCESMQVVEDIYKGESPVIKALKIRHIGNWKFLGNAWKYGMVRCHGKAAIYKYNKENPSYEVYENMKDPKVTDVYISIK